MQILQFVHGVAAQLSELEVGGAPEMALQLFLTATPASSEVAGLELITYEFFEQVRPQQFRCHFQCSKQKSLLFNSKWIHGRCYDAINSRCLDDMPRQSSSALLTLSRQKP